MNWGRKKWVKSITYWAGILTLILADGSLGWDDILIGILAIPLYFKLIFWGEI